MEQLKFSYSTHEVADKKVHIGVVGSGDLEVLFEPTLSDKTEVLVITGSNGFKSVWDKVLTRFFERYPILAKVTIHDFGATPGVVNLRLTQALEVLKYEKK